MMTTPAAAVKNEIRQLMNLDIEVFGRPPHASQVSKWQNVASEPNASGYWGRNSTASIFASSGTSTSGRHLIIHCQILEAPMTNHHPRMYV